MYNFFNILIGVFFASLMGWAVYGQASESFGDWSVGAQAATAGFAFMVIVVLGWFAFEPKRVS